MFHRSPKTPFPAETTVQIPREFLAPGWNAIFVYGYSFFGTQVGIVEQSFVLPMCGEQSGTTTDKEIRSTASNRVEVRRCSGERTHFESWIPSCNAGYYEKTAGSCSQVEAGYYSPAQNKNRYSCPSGSINNGVLASRAGLSSKAECIVCNQGHVVGLTNYQCHPREQACAGSSVQIFDPYTEAYGTCRDQPIKPTVSIHRGDFGNLGGDFDDLNSDKGNALVLTGECSSIRGRIVFSVSGNVNGSPYSVQRTTTCQSDSTWGRENINLSPFVNGKEILSIKVSHFDSDGRPATEATSTINNFCPDNYVALPALSGYTNDKICVAKYEMKSGSKATSTYAGQPHANISRDDSGSTVGAINRCQALGDGYDLITNDEWQALARNIESVGSNWSGGQVGSGQGLSVGYDTSSSFIAASKDDDKACESTVTDECNSTTWHTNRRTFALSNGEMIWDVAGNVWEWVKDDIDTSIVWANSPVSLLEDSDSLVTALTIGGKAGSTRNAKGHFGPHGDHSSFNDIGTNYGRLGYAWLDSIGGAIRRGGSGRKFLQQDDGSLMSVDWDGLFSVHLKDAADGGLDQNHGYRCVYHPPTSAP